MVRGVMVRLTRLVLIGVLLALAGCATVPEGEPDLPIGQREALWQKHQPRLLALMSWEMKGRLGLKVPQRFGSMSIDWEQQGQRYRIFLDGPFGVSVARITGSPDGVQVQVSDEQHMGATPEALVRQLTGWDFPVSYLKYWVRGLPAPDSRSAVDLNNLGYPKSIRQHGWEVSYQQYQPAGAFQLPSRMTASSGEVRLSLIVSHWQTP